MEDMQRGTVWQARVRAAYSARSRGWMNCWGVFMYRLGGLIRWFRLAAPSGLPDSRLEAPSLSETGSVLPPG